MRILVVEDEERLAEALGQIFRQNRYAADVVYDGISGCDYASSGLYDVVVLDVMLPGMDGFEVVRRLRAEGNPVPVLLLTAKDEVADKVRGLDSGADDYLTKPFVPDELLARIRALSRRQGEVVLDEMSFGDLTLSLSTCLLAKGAKSVRLGFKEFEVLKLLLANSSRIVPKEDLIVKVWGADSEADDNNVEAYISFLRKKLSYLGSGVSISSARRVGYYLEWENAREQR